MRITGVGRGAESPSGEGPIANVLKRNKELTRDVTEPYFKGPAQPVEEKSRKKHGISKKPTNPEANKINNMIQLRNK